MIQRHDHWDATILDPVETWMLATKDSKDWVSWDLSDIRMRPLGRNGRRILANLVYSDARCMDVFVGGKTVRRNGVTQTLDEKRIATNLEDASIEYYRDI